MLLKEFDLDLPYIIDTQRIERIMVENNCTRNEATKLDYEINWKGLRREFRLQTRCISSMFERLFGKFNTNECWKILVECVSEVNEDKIVDLDGVFTIRVRLSIEDFLSSDDYQKKLIALELLMDGIKKIASTESWDMEVFDTTYNKVRELNYNNVWIWKKPVESPNKHFIAQVLCQHEVMDIRIFLTVTNKSGAELVRKRIITELPDEFAYAKHLGKLKWVSENEVALVSKKGDNIWSAKIG